MKETVRFILMVLALLAGALGLSAQAQSDYPNAPIRLIVSFPPGSTTDQIARQLALRLAAQMGTTFVIDNKLGAAGNIGNDFVAKSRPDGYTLLFNTSGVVLSPALGEKVNYDVFKDLMPIGFVASVPLSLMVHPSVPVRNVEELVKHLQANPNKLAYGSGGIGNITHLAPLLFLQANKAQALHVPYKGVPPVVFDVISGRLQFAMVSMLDKDDRVKVLATTGTRRTALLPDVPTVAETVMPGFEASSWFGVMAPAGLPPAIARRLNDEIAKALQDPEMKSVLGRQGIQVGPPTSMDEYGAYLRSEAKRWAEVISSSNVKLE